MSTTYLCPLDHLTVAKISGSDADEFLQGQFTSDFRLLEDGKFQFSAWCDAKGRVLVNFIICRQGDDFYLLFHKELSEKILSRLQMFILRSDVAIQRDPEQVIAGLFVEDPNSTTLNIPLEPMEFTIENEVILLNINGETHRMLMIGEKSAINDLADHYGYSIKGSTSEEWISADILAGIPWVDLVSTEQFLPQELNLDHSEGLSYNKGCFPGQEIIARLHYRGNIKKRLYTATIDAGKLGIEPGMKLINQQSKATLGTILNACHYEDKQHMLAVADTEASQSGDIMLAGTDGPAIHLQPVNS